MSQFVQQHAAARRASCWWLPGVSVAVEDSGCIGCLTGWSYRMLWGFWPLVVVSAGVPTTHLAGSQGNTGINDFNMIPATV